MGCTYTEYMEQPQWFVELYRIKLETEAEHEKLSQPKSNVS